MIILVPPTPPPPPYLSTCTEMKASVENVALRSPANCGSSECCLFHVTLKRRLETGGEGKGKVNPVTGHTKDQKGAEVNLYSSFNLGTRWAWVVNATPRPFYPQERPGTRCIGGWVGSRVGVDGCEKSRPPPTRIRSTDHPVRSESLYRLSYRGPLETGGGL